MQRDPAITADMDALNTFAKDTPGLFDAACAVTTDMRVLARIYRNRGLFMAIHNGYQVNGQVYRASSDPHGSLYFASPSVRHGNSAADDTVFYISDLGLYFRVDSKGHETLLNALIDYKNCSFRSAPDGSLLPMLPVNLYQLVLSNRKQKLILVFTQADLRERLKRYIIECFGPSTTVETSGEHMRIGVEGTTEAELSALYDRLYAHIRDADDRACYQAIRHLPVEGREPYLHRVVHCSDTADERPDRPEDYLKRLQGVAHVMIVHGNITINGDNNVVNGNMTIGANPADKHARAIAWIQANPPAMREGAGAYYKKYKASIGATVGVSVQAFTAEVKDQGHTHHSCKTGNYWMPLQGNAH